MVDKDRYETPTRWPPPRGSQITKRVLGPLRRYSSIVLRYGILFSVLAGLGYALYRAPHDCANVVTPLIPEISLPRNPLFSRPAAAPNGTAWPESSDYLAGYPRSNVFGLASVVADN